MKYTALTSAATALLVANSYGDISYSMPALNDVGSASGTQIEKNVSVGNHWQYKITGYTWQLAASNPASGTLDSDGYYLDTDGEKVSRSAELGLSVNGQTIASGHTLTTNRIAGEDGKIIFTGGTVTLSEPIVLTNEQIGFVVRQQTEMSGDSGSYIQLAGVAIKSAPEPSGEIKAYNLRQTDAENYYLAAYDTVPTIAWKITKEGNTGSTPDASVSTGTWSYTDLASDGTDSGTDSGSGDSITPGDTDSSVVNVDPIEADADILAPNNGKNKTNNGHGNNIDGIDSSNPGKSAAKWEEKFGIVDGPNDDEGTGGGAAPSLQ